MIQNKKKLNQNKNAPQRVSWHPSLPGPPLPFRCYLDFSVGQNTSRTTRQPTKAQHLKYSNTSLNLQNYYQCQNFYYKKFIYLNVSKSVTDQELITCILTYIIHSGPITIRWHYSSYLYQVHKSCPELPSSVFFDLFKHIFTGINYRGERPMKKAFTNRPQKNLGGSGRGSGRGRGRGRGL